MPEPIPIRRDAPPAHDLDALTEISDAVESGLGLPEVVRAAARALDASLVLIDRSSAVLAVLRRTSCAWATRSSAGCACAAARASRGPRCCAWSRR
jgi:hypothetical protein